MKDDKRIEQLENKKQLYREKQPQPHIWKGPGKQWNMLEG